MSVTLVFVAWALCLGLRVFCCSSWFGLRDLIVVGWLFRTLIYFCVCFGYGLLTCCSGFLLCV